MVKEEENSVYVGGLPWETRACELEAAFRSLGSILETKVMVEQNGRSLGFGYVTFADRSEAYDAIKQMDGKMLGRRCVSVRKARPKYDEPSYASFSCRGPYGEGDDSVGDFCFSCKGLDEGCSVYVGNLPWKTDACELEAAFSQFGSILQTKVMVEQNGRSCGFGYVTFADRSEAYDAINQMDCEGIGGRCVSVKMARPEFDEPSYASFSCRGPYGEVDDDSEGDVCISCKGLYKLHEETSIVSGGSESSYALSSEVDVEEEEVPDKLSDRSGSPTGNNNKQMEVDGQNLEDIPKKLSHSATTDDTTANGNYNSDQSEVEGEDVEEIPEKLSDNSSATTTTTTTTNGNNNNDQSEVDEEDLEEIPEKLSDRTTTAAANTNTNTNTNTNNSKQSEVDGDDLEEITEKLSDSTTAATTTTTNGNNNNDQSEVDEEDLEEILEELSDSSTTSAATATSGNNNSNKLTELDGEDLEEITEKFSDSTTAATATNGNKNNDQSEVSGEDLEEIPEKLIDGTTTATAAATNGNNNNKLSEVDGEILEENPEKLCDSTATATTTTKGNNKSQSEVNEEDLEEINEKLSDTTTTTTTTTKGNKNKQSKVDGEDLEEISEKLSDSTTAANNKQPESDGEDLKETPENLGSSTATTTNKKQPEVDGEDLEEIGGKSSDITTAAAAATTTTTTITTKQSVDGEDFEEIPVKLCDKTTASAATTTTSKQREVDGEDLEEIHEKLIDITTADATTTTTNGNNTKLSQVDGEDFEEIPEKLCDSTTAAATSYSNNSVESKILPQDPEHLYSVVSTLSQRGRYAGGAGRVGEDNCMICGCPLHWACNCSSIGASLLDKDDDPSNVVCQNDDSDSVSLPSSFEEKEVVLDPVSLFEGVEDCSELAKIFKLKPSTFLKVPQELTPRFRRLVLNEFALFLSDIGKIDLENLDRETLRNLLLTLKDFKNNKLELDWLEQRLQAKHAVSEVNRANACLKELEAELVAIERRAKEIKVETDNLKTTIDQRSEYLLKHSSNVNGDVAQDLFCSCIVLNKQVLSCSYLL